MGIANLIAGHFGSDEDHWVLPYDYDAVCEALAADGNPTNDCVRVETGSDFFISPQVSGSYTGYDYTFAPVDLDLRAAWAWTWTDAAVHSVRLQPGKKFIVEGDFVAEDVTLTRVPGQAKWGGIVGAGPGGVTMDGVTVEHATTGLIVYQYGTADVTESTFQHNTVGLDVRSNSGVTVSGSAFDENGYGVTSGPIEVLDGPQVCFSSCRSAFTLTRTPSGTPTTVTNSGATGVQAYSTNADIRWTVISENDAAGLAVSNADVDPFQFNVVEENGYADNTFALSFGVSVLSGGDLYLSPLSPTPDLGLNRIKGNAAAEVWLYSGSHAFIGDGSGETGYNSIYDTGGTLIANYSGAKVYAQNTFWGTGSAPPAGAFAGPLPVVATNPLDCDYTVSPPYCAGSRVPEAGLLAAGGGAGRGAMAWLGEEIRRLRAEVAAGPGASGAAGVLRSLYALQRLDRDDAHGERAATMALLALLRGRLLQGTLPAPLRATAEAALASEVSDALLHEDYGTAGELLAGYGAGVEGEGVRRELALAEAVLDAQAGRYAEAAARVAAVAAAEEDESAAQALSALAEAYARRAGGGKGRVGVPPAMASAGASAAASSPSAVLTVSPNPFGAAAVVALEVASQRPVRVEAFDALGRRVAVLHEGVLAAGRHAFRLDGATLPSGVYLVRAVAGEETLTRRLTLVK